MTADWIVAATLGVGSAAMLSLIVRGVRQRNWQVAALALLAAVIAAVLAADTGVRAATGASDPVLSALTATITWIEVVALAGYAVAAYRRGDRLLAAGSAGASLLLLAALIF